MAPGPPLGRGDSSWTPRGMVMVGFMAVLAAVLVLSHFGVSAAVLLGVAAVAALVTGITLYRLPTEAQRRKEEQR